MKNNVLLILVYGAMIFAVEMGKTACGAIVLNPIQDSSIYSESNNSNGVGSLFAARSGAGVRRALLQFDIAGNIPAGSIIQSVTLGLTQLKHAANSVNQSFELHPLLSAWSEGTNAGTGSGTAPNAGDPTWNHRAFSTEFWISPGADFGPVSGTTTIGTADNTLYTFSSQSGMLTDVQNWLDNPSSNFGWILRDSAEAIVNGAREFGSREASIDLRPTLTIDFVAVPEPNSIVLLGVAVLVGATSRLGRIRSPRMFERSRTACLSKVARESRVPVANPRIER